MSAKLISVSLSHGRPRTEVRRPSDGGTPPLPVESAPTNDTKTGRVLPGNRLWKKREAKRADLVRRRKGISTLNPETCEPWLRPFVLEAVRYGLDLQARFDEPALARLIGDTADAHAIYKGLIALGSKGDTKALTEARGWLREHRACLRELAALAGLVTEKSNDEADAPWINGGGDTP
jgi:hypothetical protein